MTEIQFLISIILEHKLPEAVKVKLIARIGEVEALLQKPGHQSAVTPKPNPPVLFQVASTQKILNEMAMEVPAPVIVQRAPTPPAPIDKETGRPIVSTGKGTFGPRKF